MRLIIFLLILVGIVCLTNYFDNKMIQQQVDKCVSLGGTPFTDYNKFIQCYPKENK